MRRLRQLKTWTDPVQAAEAKVEELLSWMESVEQDPVKDDVTKLTSEAGSIQIELAQVDASVGGKTGVAQVDPAPAREHGSVAGDACGQHTIELVHPARHAFKQVFRAADAHQIARLLTWQ